MMTEEFIEMVQAAYPDGEPDIDTIPEEPTVYLSQDQYEQLRAQMLKSYDEFAQMMKLMAQAFAMSMGPLKEMIEFIGQELVCLKHNGKNPCVLGRGHEGKCSSTMEEDINDEGT